MAGRSAEETESGLSTLPRSGGLGLTEGGSGDFVPYIKYIKKNK
jgi:hypothetical protein